MNKKLKLEELKRIDFTTFKESKKIPLIIVLDNIRSLNNIGSIFRTADAFRLEKIFLCGLTATPPHRDIHKTALGATESVEWVYYEEAEDAINFLKEESYQICSIEQVEGSILLQEYIPTFKTAVILGNEVEGVQQKLINQSDICIEIPQFGTKHSLNVSVCTGIVVWEIVNKLNFPIS